AGVDFFQPNQGFEERGFSDTVWTDNANNAVWWQREAEVINQGTTVKALGDVVGFDHLAAQAWTGWDLDFFEVQYTGFFGFGGHFFVAFQTSFLLGLATLGVGANPVEFFFQTTSKLSILLALNIQTFTFLF